MDFKKTILIIFSLIFILKNLNSQNLQGTIRDAISGEKLTGATVILTATDLPSETKTTATDADGFYFFEKNRPGYYRLEVSFLGFEKQIFTEILMADGRKKIVDIALQNAPGNLATVTVTAPLPRRPLPISEIQLPLDRVQRFPVTFFDPARLAAAFPGVVATNDGTNAMSVRGNSPATVGWRLEGVDIVNPNHLPNAGLFNDQPGAASGGVLMFSAQMLDNCALLTGNFPAGYGNALGGIMDMYLRPGSSENHEFTAQAGLVGLDLSAGGPLRKGKSKASYLMNYRYSTVGLLGKLGVSFGDEQIDFQDFSFNFNFPSKRGGGWKIFGMAGSSNNFFAAKTDSADFKTGKDKWTIDFSSNTFLVGISGDSRLNKKTRFKSSVIFSSQKNDWTAATIFPHPFGAQVGIEKNYGQLAATFSIKHLIMNGIEFSAGVQPNLLFELQSEFGPVGMILQPWMQIDWKMLDGRLALQAGVHRVLNVSEDDYLPEYRLAGTFQINENQSITASTGTQNFTDIQNHIFSFGFGVANVNFIKSNQTAVRHELKFNPKWTLKSEIFYQQLSGVHANSSGNYWVLNQPEFKDLNNPRTGEGKNYGLEISLDRSLAAGFFTNLNTTIFDSKYRTAPGNDWKSTRWDVGHVLNLSAGKEWSREKSTEKIRTLGISARAVWMGGSREQPVVAFVPENGNPANEVYPVYNLSADFSFQNPDYFRLDARFYLKKNLAGRRNSLVALEFQNLTNQKNVAWHFYNTVSREIEVKYQLGLIPNLSWRIEF